MPTKKKRVWTEEHFRASFKDMGAKAPKAGTPNPEMHKDLVELLKQRDAKADVEERMNNLFDIANKDLAKPVHKEDVGTTDVISNCATFGTGYDAKADVCKNCEDGPEGIALCREKTLAFKKAAKAKKASHASMNTKKRYENLVELQAHMKEAPNNKITMRLDKLLVAGNLKLTTLVKKMEKARTELSTPDNPVNDFSKASRIKSHIKFREKNNEWIFTWEGENKDIPKVTGIREVQIEPLVEKVAAVG